MWAVVCLWGGLLSTLGVQLSGIWADVCMWGNPLSTLGSSCQRYGLSPGVQLSEICAVVCIGLQWEEPEEQQEEKQEEQEEQQEEQEQQRDEGEKSRVRKIEQP